MNKILVLGAGMVSKPLVRYLLDQPNFFVTMASRTVSKAEKIINGHKNGVALSLNINDDVKLEDLISKADLTVSLLPYEYHVKVAKLCIKHKKHLVTTSYVSNKMRELDKEAKKARVILLNECGLDPGIDHMSAMRVINNAEDEGGKIISFKSSTGALPSHEANNNPFGYKFSWSPRGVLLASLNPSKWIQDGKIKSFPGEKLFENYIIQDISGVGSFENYPNRNSVPYKDIYGLKDAKTVYRGTFRMIGWCETMRNIVKLGWLKEKPIIDFKGKTYGDLTRHLIGIRMEDNLIKSTAEYLDLPIYSTIIKRFEWLGLFGQELLPENMDNALDYFNKLTIKKMSLENGERDMIIMHHEFVVDNTIHTSYITSTLVDYGIPYGDNAVARTVALPAAIAVKMIINNKIKLKGVYIPVIPEIYNPILNELEEIGIKFVENKKILN
jgi:saccharopine dehydrogenase (NADP+, L-glutamate forming)/spermidine synthase